MFSEVFGISGGEWGEARLEAAAAWGHHDMIIYAMNTNEQMVDDER